MSHSPKEDAKDEQVVLWKGQLFRGGTAGGGLWKRVMREEVGGGMYSCVKCWLVDEDASVMQMWIECEETKRMRKC